MKNFIKNIAFLLFLVAYSGNVWGTDVTWTVSGVGANGKTQTTQTLTATKDPSSETGTWTAYSSTSYYGGSNSGAQLGSSSSQFNGTITLSSTAIPSSATITSIEVGCYTKNLGTYTLSATVGGDSFGNSQTTPTNTGTPKVTFTGSKVGNAIVITASTSTNAYLLIKTIKVTYSTATLYTITRSGSPAGTVTGGTFNTSASSAAAGTTITLTATPSTGYELDYWTVTDASSNPVSVTNNQFTMPAKAVTVNATFRHKTYTFGSTLTNCSSSPSLPSSYTHTGSPAGLSYTISANDGYVLPAGITLTMGGSAMTQSTDYTWNQSTGALSISKVITGNIALTITAVHKLTGISITTQPTKRAYIDGESFSSSGATVTASYGAAPASATVSANWTPTGSMSAETGKTITASYTENLITKTATTTVNVYGVTMQAQDEDGNAIAVGGPAAPTRSVTSINPQADAGNYKFWKWIVENATLGSAETTKSNTISSPTGAITVTAVYYKPCIVTWKVKGEVWTPASPGTASVTTGTNWSALTLPTDPTTVEGCGDKFMGWIAEEIDGEKSAEEDIEEIEGKLLNSSNKSSKTGNIITRAITFHAVFADYGE